MQQQEVLHDKIWSTLLSLKPRCPQLAQSNGLTKLVVSRVIQILHDLLCKESIGEPSLDPFTIININSAVRRCRGYPWLIFLV